MGNEPESWSDWLYFLVTHPLVVLTVGGAVGTLLRYGVGRWFAGMEWTSGYSYYGTFVINVTGSFVLGFAFIPFYQMFPPERRAWWLLVGTGFCGGYTTFSSFELETLQLIIDGSWGRALGYVLTSVIVGFFAVFLGANLAQWLFPQV